MAISPIDVRWKLGRRPLAQRVWDGILKRMATNKVLINRAPVLTLWAAIVAERLGFNHDEALSLGMALAGLNAQSKGQRLGIPPPQPEGTQKGT